MKRTVAIFMSFDKKIPFIKSGLQKWKISNQESQSYYQNKIFERNENLKIKSVTPQ